MAKICLVINLEYQNIKKGNSHIREALYISALCACRFDDNMKSSYPILNQRQKAKKTKSCYCYELKNKQEYNVNYKWEK